MGINIGKFFRSLLTPNKNLKKIEVKFTPQDYALLLSIIGGTVTPDQLSTVMVGKLAAELNVTVGDLLGAANVAKAIKAKVDWK